MQQRAIPRTGELLPVVGLGTWRTFDVGPGEAERAPLRRVLSLFSRAGARVVDSSPMYGRSEGAVGDLAVEAKLEGKLFLATKVWTRGRDEGIAQMDRSMRRMRTDLVDLMQVHNLVDAGVHLKTLRAWKKAGRVRYIGVTHYSTGAFGDLEQLMRSEELDFVQLPYSLGMRHAEKRLLPEAEATGTAVLVMRPFEEGALHRRLQGRPLPGFAQALGCARWSQLLLKFVLSHRAVTCALPATSSPEHLAENVAAGEGPQLDESQREELVRFAGD